MLKRSKVNNLIFYLKKLQAQDQPEQKTEKRKKMIGVNK